MSNESRPADPFERVLLGYGFRPEQARECANNTAAALDGVDDEAGRIEGIRMSLDWRAKHPDTYGEGYDALDRMRVAQEMYRAAFERPELARTGKRPAYCRFGHVDVGLCDALCLRRGLRAREVRTWGRR